MESLYSTCICVSPQRMKPKLVEPEETSVVRQRLSKHVPTAINTHATTEELFDMLFSIRSVSYKTCSDTYVSRRQQNSWSWISRGLKPGMTVLAKPAAIYPTDRK
jgi:hypothetical protein